MLSAAYWACPCSTYLNRRASAEEGAELMLEQMCGELRETQIVALPYATVDQQYSQPRVVSVLSIQPLTQ